MDGSVMRWWERKHDYGFLVVLVLVLLLLICTASKLLADTYRITHDEGGILTDYVDRFHQLSLSGKTVIIDGHCFSACTVVLMLPPGRRCATPQARLHFHSAYVSYPWMPWVRFTDVQMTQYMQQFYPGSVRKWINQRGGLTNRYITLAPNEIYKHVRPCR
jgi:hypothetical protein